MARADEEMVITHQSVQSHLDEKEELSDLNDRLASYIDCMRSLEKRNSKLSLELSQASESSTRKVEAANRMYEAEVAESRRIVDQITKQTAELKLENNELNGIINDMQPKLEKIVEEKELTQSKLQVNERSRIEKDGLIALHVNDQTVLQNRVKELDLLSGNLRKKLDQAKQLIEKETLARADSEKRLLAMKGEGSFVSHLDKEQVRKMHEDVYVVFQQQLNEKDEKYSKLVERCTKLQSEVIALSEYKCSLDKELTEYNTLLEGEEFRLNINKEQTSTEL